MHQESFVRPEGRINPRRQPRFPDPHMRLQGICGVICRADDRDPIRRENIMDAHRRELRISLLPNFLRRTRIDRGLETEVTLQLKMRPMIQRIAQGVWHGRTPSLMLFPRRGVTRTKALGHAICPQRPPFIVISPEPDFAEISKLMVVGNLRRRQVTVVIVNRFSGGVGVIQCARRIRLQEKVVVNEGLGHLEFWIRDFL